jgi:hypothetical protein
MWMDKGCQRIKTSQNWWLARPTTRFVVIGLYQIGLHATTAVDLYKTRQFWTKPRKETFYDVPHKNSKNVETVYDVPHKNSKNVDI